MQVPYNPPPCRPCKQIATIREPPFEAALDCLQFNYTADRARAYVAPASTVLVPSAVAEGEDLFGALLAHLRRRYPEVYGLGDTLARAPERRETQIRAKEGISGGSLIVTSSLNLGAYASRFDNLNLAGINKPSPNLTTMYLDTPLVGPTPEPLEYVPLPGRLGRPHGYPPSSTGPWSDSARRRPPPPPPSYNTHPCMRSSIGWAQPRRVVEASGLVGNLQILAPQGEPLAKFWSAALLKPNPPYTRSGAQGGGREIARGVHRLATAPEKNRVLENRREPLAEF